MNKLIEKLIRFDREADLSLLTETFGEYGKAIYKDMKDYGILSTLHYMSEENRLKLEGLIKDF